MTTKAAAAFYEAQHVQSVKGLKNAIYNPLNKPVDELPVIYGFNNGGRPEWYSAVLISEDGYYLGGHICSSEAYMPADLGILEGTRPDRHETFKEHYPDGYRMEFVSFNDVRSHEKLNIAFKKNDEMQAAENIETMNNKEDNQ